MQYLTTVTSKILLVTVGVILIVAFSTYFERKVIGSMQARVGPNRVGPLGLLQPFADVFKLLFKEVIIPSRSNRFLFVIAPLLTLIPALAAWAVRKSHSCGGTCRITVGMTKGAYCTR